MMWARRAAGAGAAASASTSRAITQAASRAAATAAGAAGAPRLHTGRRCRTYTTLTTGGLSPTPPRLSPASTGAAAAAERSDLTADAEADADAESAAAPAAGHWSPRDVYAYLDEHIVGQPRLKRALAVAVHAHFKRVQLNRETAAARADGAARADAVDGVRVDKSSLLVLGPTGSGKTALARAVADLLDVPIVIVEATSLTQAGYVGDDVEVCVKRLLEAAHYDVALAEQGIVVIDEIDKLARKTAPQSGARDVSGEGVQQALLRLLEQSRVTVKATPATRRYLLPRAGEHFVVNTDDILFICTGAFPALPDIIQRRLDAGHGFGFAAPTAPSASPAQSPSLSPSPSTRPQALSIPATLPLPVRQADGHVTHDVFATEASHSLLQHVTTEDLIEYGFIREFVGRFGIVAHTEELTRDELIAVLTEPKHALVKQFERLFRSSGVQLLCHPASFGAIADLALTTAIGARGLRRIMHQVLQEAQFAYSDSDVAYAVIQPDLSVAGFLKDEWQEAYRAAGRDPAAWSPPAAARASDPAPIARDPHGWAARDAVAGPLRHTSSPSPSPPDALRRRVPVPTVKLAAVHSTASVSASDRSAASRGSPTPSPPSTPLSPPSTPPPTSMPTPVYPPYINRVSARPPAAVSSRVVEAAAPSAAAASASPQRAPARGAAWSPSPSPSPSPVPASSSSSPASSSSSSPAPARIVIPPLFKPSRS